MSVSTQFPVEDRLCLLLFLRHINYLDKELAPWWDEWLLHASGSWWFWGLMDSDPAGGGNLTLGWLSLSSQGV